MVALVPCLVQLRREFNQIAPARDQDSDGWIGDAAHRARTSDHNPDETGAVPIVDADRVNEVHALDVDDDLRESNLTMARVVAFLAARCRTGAERRLRYIIYAGIIYHVDNGFRPAKYSGSNPHTEHAHFSASYDTLREASTAPWRLEDIPVALTHADKTWINARIEAAVAKVLAEVAPKVWNHTEPNPYFEHGVPGAAPTRRMGGDARLIEFRADKRLESANEHTDAVLAKVDQLLELVSGLTPDVSST